MKTVSLFAVTICSTLACTLAYGGLFIWYSKVTTVETADSYSYDVGYDFVDTTTRNELPGVRAILVPLISDLVKLPPEELFIIKIEENVCDRTDLVNCRGLPPDKVRHYADLALTQVQLRDDRKLRSSANLTGRIAVVIAMLSLCVSVSTLVRDMIVERKRRYIDNT